MMTIALEQIVPGQLVTPRCTGLVNHHRCFWPITTLCGKRWLCSWCREQWQIRRLCIRARRVYNRRMRRGKT